MTQTTTLDVPALREQAYRLWMRFKTDTATYRNLAEKLGMNTASLNRQCWHINHARTGGK